MVEPSVVIDCFPERVARYAGTHAIVAVDVIRATTTAVTVVAGGGRCFPVASLEAAARLASGMPEALIVGELGGSVPSGFALGNSPAAFAAGSDLLRSIILLSSSGTRLMDAAQAGEAAYVACFRNARALARRIANRHPRIAVIGAGSRGEFRVEDQICCAWIAAELMARGHAPADGATSDLVARLCFAPASACADGPSAAYLRATGQLEDLDFVLAHVDDLDAIFTIVAGEVLMAPPARPARRMAVA